MEISAIILAGGRGTRLAGRDKGWLQYHGVPLIKRVVGRLQPQVDEIIISCNRNVRRYQQLGFPVVTDTSSDFPGPMAGVAAAAHLCRGDAILLSPCDNPKLPADLVARLKQALLDANADIAVPTDNFGPQYLSSLLRREAALGAQAALASGQRTVRRWLGAFTRVEVDFTASGDGFGNINSLEDLVTD
jgi:molybdenum cofactor guanylyltransferase